MGTGKTKVALDFVATLLWYKRISKALIIAPLTVIDGTWEEEIENNCPWVRYQILRPGDRVHPEAQLVLVNYEFFRPITKKKRSKRTGEILKNKYGRAKKFKDSAIVDMLCSWFPDVTVLDESHKIKNPKSRSAKAAHKLSGYSTYRMCLTGTPTGNKKKLELWSQIHFLVPGLLGKYQDYKDQYFRFNGFGGFKVTGVKPSFDKEVIPKIAPYIMVKKAEGLPPQNEINIRIKMPPRAKELYQKMEEDFVAEFSGVEVSAAIALSKMIKLSEIAGGFIKTNDGQCIDVHTAKLEALKNLCDDLLEQDTKRVVIFARFTWEVQKIKETLSSTWPVYEISGNTSREDKKLAQSRYNSEEGGAIVAQIASGSLGLNLQKGNYEILYSLDYSYINYVQLIKRIHRMGQTKPCFYYFLKSIGTIDSRIHRSLKENRDVASDLHRILEDMGGSRNAHA